MPRCVFFLLFLLLAGVSLRADEMTKATQEALRTRKLYYGEVDGNSNPETTEALQRFQEKKGLDPTGRLDETTLRALGLLPHSSLRAPAVDRVEQARDFIARYLQACTEQDLQAELAFFAPRVNYFDDGPSTKEAIAARLGQYRENWPERHFALLHCVASPSREHADEMIVTFRARFQTRRGPEREREGFQDLRVVLRSSGALLQIVSIQEA